MQCNWLQKPVIKDVAVDETHLMYQSLVFWLDPVPV